jgi:hypothetical protein
MLLLLFSNGISIDELSHNVSWRASNDFQKLYYPPVFIRMVQGLYIGYSTKPFNSTHAGSTVIKPIVLSFITMVYVELIMHTR